LQEKDALRQQENEKQEKGAERDAQPLEIVRSRFLGVTASVDLKRRNAIVPAMSGFHLVLL